ITAVVNGTGYMVGADGTLLRFDPDSVRGGAPTRLDRPSRDPSPAFVANRASEQAALTAFELVMSPSVPSSRAAAHLQDARELAPLRSQLGAAAGRLFGAVELVVTDVAVQGDEASITYEYRVNGGSAFAPFSG